MDNIRAACVLVVTVLTCFDAGNALIGLRPPPKHTKNKEDLLVPVSPRPSQIHDPRGNLASAPDANPVRAGAYQYRDRHSNECHAQPLLRCSYIMLKNHLQQNVAVCTSVKGFSDCITGMLRQDGRREFVHGLTVLGELNKLFYSTHGCHSNVTIPLPLHTRHERSKRMAKLCCLDDVINCTVQTFLKMVANPSEDCQLVDYYSTCLHHSLVSCSELSLNASFPVYIQDLKRKCNTSRRK